MGRDEGVVSTTSSISESVPSGVFFFDAVVVDVVVAFLDDGDNNKDSSEVETLVRTRFGLEQPVSSIESLRREVESAFDEGVEAGGVNR